MTPLKWIVSEAKKLKKKYPHRFKKWTDYVAQASAIYASKHKGKSPVGKKRKVSGVKKKAVKKKAVKKSPVRSMHKDTKSHNVNIRVMSGSNKLNIINKENDILQRIKSLIKYNDDINLHIIKWKERLKNDKSDTFLKLQKKSVQENIKKYTKLLKSNKKYLIELKKSI